MTTTQESPMASTDRIEKQVLINAPKSRVWRALTNATEFGQWFQVKLEGTFEVGRSVKGRITHPGYEHITMEWTVVRMDAENFFSYRWHPHAIDPSVDYTAEPTTLVEFRLTETPEGTLLTIVESGFDKLPISRREEAFRGNDGGWSGQIKNIRRHAEK
ncbi:MAG: SRPBCC family protein [Gemmatimonadota bacterium]